MGDLDCCGVAIVFVAMFFVLSVVASPGFLVYGFFSTEWLVENLGNNKTSNDSRPSWFRTTPKPADQVFHGLFKKCGRQGCVNEILEGTTFGLEVTAVTLQFLAILALPWLKACFPENKVLKYWNYCFLPLMVMAAIFSIAGSQYFADYYNHHRNTETEFLGKSQTLAAAGGFCQIILACVIAYFFWKNNLLCCKRSSSDTFSGVVVNTPAPTPAPTPRPTPSTHDNRFNRGSAFFSGTLTRFFAYESPTGDIGIGMVEVRVEGKETH